jgi:lysozyme
MAKQPEPIQTSAKPGRGKVVAGGLFAVALAIATPFIGGWEGKSNDPYFDIAHVQTVCFGETRVEMRRYTDAECEAMLRDAVGEFMEPVAEMTPTIAEKPKLLAAATSLSYNAGLANYRSSTVRRRFLARDFKGACLAFAAWNKSTVPAATARKLMARGETCKRKANGAWLCTVKGLTNRRAAETKLCLEGTE